MVLVQETFHCKRERQGRRKRETEREEDRQTVTELCGGDRERETETERSEYKTINANTCALEDHT